MTIAQFLTVADAVRASSDKFQDAVISGLKDGAAKMSEAQLKEAFFPELVGAEVGQAIRAAA